MKTDQNNPYYPNFSYFYDEFEINDETTTRYDCNLHGYKIIVKVNHDFKDLYDPNNYDKLELLHFGSVTRNNPERQKGRGRKLLCALLHSIIYTSRITENDIIKADAIESVDGNLIHKVYYPMGFKIDAYDAKRNHGFSYRGEEDGGYVYAKLKDVIAYCNNNHKIEKTTTGRKSKSKKLKTTTKKRKLR